MNFFQVSQYYINTYYLEDISNIEISGEDLIRNIAGHGPMDVTKETYKESKVAYGSYRTEAGDIVVLDNGVLLEGEDALESFNRHDRYRGLPDENIVIKEFSMELGASEYPIIYAG